MDLLERYLRQIKRYLPIPEREETVKELQSLILDQLDEKQASGMEEETALRAILVEMGDPRDVALRYTDKAPLISRQMEPIMMLVMKILSITLPLVILFATSLEFVTSHADFTFSDFLVQLALAIPSALYAMVVAIGTVFIIFIAIERFLNPKFDTQPKEFIPELLPELPTKVFNVSILGSIITILVNIGVLYLINFQQGLIGVYYENTRYPLLNENFDNLVPFFNIGWFVTILLHVYYLYRQKKNIASKTIEFLQGLYAGVLMIMVATGDIFNDVIIDGYNLEVVPNIIKYIFLFVALAAIVGAIVEYVKLFINLDKLDSIPKK